MENTRNKIDKMIAAHGPHLILEQLRAYYLRMAIEFARQSDADMQAHHKQCASLIQQVLDVE